MADTTALEQNEFMAVEKPVSRISWGGIFIGAIATIALGLLLHSLGAAIGLTAINPAAGEWGGNAGLWTGIWSFLSIVLATFFGAWVASRASTVFFKKDAGSLGFMTWALSFLGMLFLVTLMSTLTTANLAGSALQAGGEAAGAAAGQAQGLQQQAQQQLQQIAPGQAAGGAADVGAAAGWWFFITALCAMVAGVLGGIAGAPKAAKKRMEARRTATVRTRETHA